MTAPTILDITMRKPSLLLTFLLLAFLGPLQAAEFKTDASQRQHLSLTVYNAGRALIRDHRQFSLDQAVDRIAFSGVSQQIMPQTVAIEGLEVLEQNYDYDLLSPESLIRKHLGRKVRIARRSGETGETLEWRSGTILSTNGGVILRMDDGSLESLERNHNYHMVFDEIPEDLRASPTLTLRLLEALSGRQEAALTYLSGGLSWQSDYVLQLNSDETRASLDSWVTLKNQSGIGYQDAQLQLLAGDVNTVAPGRDKLVMAEAMMARSVSGSQLSEEALHGYHLYSVPFKTTIRDNQSKQIRLFSADAISVEKRLEDRAWINQRGLALQKSKPDQILVIDNQKPTLGLPLPQGIIRVYADDSQGQKQFLGEDRIGHTAVNDTIELHIGKAFDISIERETTAYQTISKTQQRVARKLRINNGGNSSQTINLFEIMPAADWSILQSSHPQQRNGPQELKYSVEIPALQEIEISYTVQINHP
jgi:hypothetical protein